MYETLKNYGFTEAEIFAAEEYISTKSSKKENSQEYYPGRIIEERRERYKVICEKGELEAEIKGSFFHDLKEGDLFPVVGDFIVIRYNEHGPSMIDKVLNRRSRFSRVDFLGHAVGYAKNVKEQVNAANFDYVFILSSLNHDLNINRLARYLTASLQSGGFPVFVLTKADLVEDPYSKAAEVRKMTSGISGAAPVICISSLTGFGLEELEPFLEPGKTAVFLGSSGVGKSSLLNRLAGEELMEVKTIRDDDSKGRHTTTYRQLFRLASGALVIDTPGMRELGLWDAREGISLAYADVEELFSQCRFNDCSHQSEPGCAVLAALEDGSLEPEKWQTYQVQVRENSFVLSHSDYLKKKQEFQKTLSKNFRNYKKGHTMPDIR
ncbi:MAG: ribosome small subunit-dependent GTPase A [Treponema sp.]|nr:ribosome small subunit-dependent GTPase A [Treponema sp.]